MPAYDCDLWCQPPSEISLGASEVHIWRACLMQPEVYVVALGETLSDDEQRRAARYRFEEDRRRFIVARGLLRQILHRYLDIPAAQIRFSYGVKGKPALALSECNLQFNLSHSREVVLFGFTLHQDLGIDLEWLHALEGMDLIADRFFSPKEKQFLGVLALQERQEAFFRLWVCKEAYIKACGRGLTMALDQFDVEIAPDGGVSLLADRQAQDAHPGHWAIQQISPGKGYVAAIAVRDHRCNLRCWQWPTDHLNACRTYEEGAFHATW